MAILILQPQFLTRERTSLPGILADWCSPRRLHSIARPELGHRGDGSGRRDTKTIEAIPIILHNTVSLISSRDCMVRPVPTQWGQSDNCLSLSLLLPGTEWDQDVKSGHLYKAGPAWKKGPLVLGNVDQLDAIISRGRRVHLGAPLTPATPGGCWSL